MPPRLLRTNEAHDYLRMNRKTFDKWVRPFIAYIRIGQRGIAFDKLDLDAWIEEHKQRDELPVSNTGEHLWEEPAHRAYKNVMATGKLTRRFSDSEFAKVLEQATLRKRKSI